MIILTKIYYDKCESSIKNILKKGKIVKKTILFISLIAIAHSFCSVGQTVHPVFRPRKGRLPQIQESITIAPSYAQQVQKEHKKRYKRNKNMAIKPEKYYVEKATVKKEVKAKPLTSNFEEIRLNKTTLDQWLQDRKKTKQLKDHIKARLVQASGINQAFKITDDNIAHAVRSSGGVNQPPSIRQITDFLIKRWGLKPLKQTKVLKQKEEYKKKIEKLRKKFYSKNKKGITQQEWSQAREIYKFIPEYHPEFRKILNIKMKNAIKHSKKIDNIKRKIYDRKARNNWTKQNNKKAERDFNRAKRATKAMPTYILQMTKLLERPLKDILKYAQKIDLAQDILIKERDPEIRKKHAKKVLKKAIYYLPEYDPYFAKTLEKQYPKLCKKYRKTDL